MIITILWLLNWIKVLDKVFCAIFTFRIFVFMYFSLIFIFIYEPIKNHFKLIC